MTAAAAAPHPWRFFRAGGVAQVEIATAADIEHLAELDQKLWLALACPTTGLELDARMLEIIDTDRDLRIRAPELIEVVDWCKSAFSDLRVFFDETKDEDGERTVRLDSIHTGTEQGRILLRQSRAILERVGKKGAASISRRDVAHAKALFAATSLNGDGIIPSSAAESDSVRQIIDEVIATCGSKQDRSGAAGIDQTHLDRFFDEVEACRAWLSRGDAPGVRVLGPETDAAYEAFVKVRAKLDDYFTRCRLLAYDEKTAFAFSPSSADSAVASGRELSRDNEAVRSLPIALPNREAILAPRAPQNPAWSEALAVFRQLTLKAFGNDPDVAITEALWADITARLTPFDTWQKAVPKGPVFALGAQRLLTLAEGDGRAQITSLIRRDAELAEESREIEEVEKMILLRLHLVQLLRNFVSFAEFYRTRQSIFQIGKLYLDGRTCEMCLPVLDVEKHAELAGLAHSYLVYAECRRVARIPPAAALPGSAEYEKQTIVAVVTAGAVDNLMVGRNGLFYDRNNEHWDATVIKVIENPIDVSQAFLTPYKRFFRFIQQQLAKRFSEESTESASSLAAQAEEVVLAAKTVAARPHIKVASPPTKIDVGTVAALGVAVGAVGAFFSSIVAMFLGLGRYMPLGVLGVVCAISGPSMASAWIKLRRRNIGPILDASGWAVNAFARINVNFGGALTKVALAPRASMNSTKDPFEDKLRVSVYGFVAVVLAIAIAALVSGTVRVTIETVLHHPLAAPASSAR